MRRSLIAAIILGGFTVFAASPLSAREAADCRVVYGLSGPVCVSGSSIDQPRHFGTRTKPQKTKVAGKVFTPSPVVSWHSSAHTWIAEARSHLGKNARQIGLSRSTLWCGTFLAEATSLPKPRVNPNWAANWGDVGTRVSGPQPGAIALIVRGRRIGHVGLVTGVDGNGNPIIISGNHNDRVVETAYPKGSVYAYVMPGA